MRRRSIGGSIVGRLDTRDDTQLFEMKHVVMTGTKHVYCRRKMNIEALIVS